MHSAPHRTHTGLFASALHKINYDQNSIFPLAIVCRCCVGEQFCGSVSHVFDVVLPACPTRIIIPKLT